MKLEGVESDGVLWFELKKVCDLLCLTTVEVLYSPVKKYFPKEFLLLKQDVLYVNSLGFLILAACDRSGKASMELAQQCILDAVKFNLGLK